MRTLANVSTQLRTSATSQDLLAPQIRQRDGETAQTVGATRWTAAQRKVRFLGVDLSHSPLTKGNPLSVDLAAVLEAFKPIRTMPFNTQRLFKVLKWGTSSNDGDWRDSVEETTSLDDADIVASESRDGWYHMPILDIDVPISVIPSSTPGHSHLFIGVQMSWSVYSNLLEAMAEAGILEPGYVNASQARGFTAVRLPWVSK